MKKINLLSHDNGVGLTQDVKILKGVLDRYDVEFIDTRHLANRKADINIFLEIVDKNRFNLAPINILIPNPEWFMDVRLVRDFDMVLAKTRDCERIFRRLGARSVEHTSFTSEDRYLPDCPKDKMFFHLAGKSETKGSEAIFRAFNQKGMPEMIFLKYQNFNRFANHPDNIEACFTRLGLDTLRLLQNRCIFHLCTSEYEGFGHYIWEGKSAGGIIITTDAPPMNEMVNYTNGFLIPGRNKRRFNQGMLVGVDSMVLAKRCQEIFHLDYKTLRLMSQESRQSFLDNDRYFRERIINIIDNL